MFIIRREASRIILNLARRRTVITIIGPRGSGKTTLARMLFPRHRYVSLEDPDVLEFARKRPGDFFRHYEGDIVIDEFRLAPELAGPMRAVMLSEKCPGRYILITSYRQMKRPENAPRVKPPPQGYAAMVYLLPLSIRELVQLNVSFDRDESICRGFMPGVFAPDADQKRVYRSYCIDYLKRSVRQSAELGDMSGFGRFMKFLAGRVGQIMNHRSFAEEAGVPVNTIYTWISALEASFIIFRLPNYFDGFGRRLVNTPKFYFTDVGLAASLLGLDTPRRVFRDPQVGNLFENMVIADALKGRYNRGRGANLYYFRSRNGLEIDLILSGMPGAFPVEIKAGASFDASFARNIEMFRRLSKRIRSGCVVYSGDERAKEGAVPYINFKDFGLVMDP